MRHIFYRIVTKVKPNINSVEVHPQLSNNRGIQWMVRRWVLVEEKALKAFHKGHITPSLFIIFFSINGNFHPCFGCILNFIAVSIVIDVMMHLIM
jgi:hypothetical protein